MLESQYQARLIKKLERKFPGCVILKKDAGYRQGIPDLVILYFGRWAALEVKVDEHAPHQANQDWWVERMNDMAYHHKNGDVIKYVKHYQRCLWKY